VDRILEDRPGGSGGPSSGDGDSNGVLGLLDDRGVSVVGWRDWEALDAHERSLGAARKGDRIKVASREEMLAIALGRA
jgi:ferredoxin--NADP+ reductase